MEDWPVQASDAELNAAERLTRRLERSGFVRITEAFLMQHTPPGPEGDSPVFSAVSLGHVGGLWGRDGEHPLAGIVRWESTGEHAVADVTQVSTELWAPEWVAPLIAAAVRCGNVRVPHTRPVKHDEADRERREAQASNAGKVRAYLTEALRVVPPGAPRAALLTLWRVTAGDSWAAHKYLSAERAREAERVSSLLAPADPGPAPDEGDCDDCGDVYASGFFDPAVMCPRHRVST